MWLMKFSYHLWWKKLDHQTIGSILSLLNGLQWCRSFLHLLWASMNVANATISTSEKFVSSLRIRCLCVKGPCQVSKVRYTKIFLVELNTLPLRYTKYNHAENFRNFSNLWIENSTTILPKMPFRSKPSRLHGRFTIHWIYKIFDMVPNPLPAI